MLSTTPGPLPEYLLSLFNGVPAIPMVPLAFGSGVAFFAIGDGLIFGITVGVGVALPYPGSPAYRGVYPPGTGVGEPEGTGRTVAVALTGDGTGPPRPKIP